MSIDKVIKIIRGVEMERITSNRLGKFEVSFEMINNCSVTVGAIMAECIVLNVELFAFNGKAIYTAISNRFEEVEEGMQIPTYYWKIEYPEECDMGKPKIVGCEKLDG